MIIVSSTEELSILYNWYYDIAFLVSGNFFSKLEINNDIHIHQVEKIALVGKDRHSTTKQSFFQTKLLYYDLCQGKKQHFKGILLHFFNSNSFSCSDHYFCSKHLYVQNENIKNCYHYWNSLNVNK